MKTTTGTAILTSVISLLLLCSAPAYAADSGDCGTPEQMTAKLGAEDQHSFATAERVHRKDGLNTLTGMIFTVNADHSVGYILESDKDTGQRASKICVYLRLADVRIFDARKPGIPSGALLRAPEENAIHRCAALVKSGKTQTGTCGALNATLKASEKKGGHVMFQGFNLEKTPDGGYRKINVLTTVTAALVKTTSPDGQVIPFDGLLGDISFSGLPDGDTTTSVILALPGYTNYGLSLLDR